MDSITCPVCTMTSYNPNDVRERYCGKCHKFHADMIVEGEIVDTPKVSFERWKRLCLGDQPHTRQ